MSNDTYDYIVIGAGAAGSVLAARLGEDPKTRVLVLEEGPHDQSFFIKAKGAYFKTHGTERTFLFHTEPEPNANNRRLVLLQGRTLGGGTSVNAMCYSRGQAADYDDWAALGCSGWSYRDVLPYFKRSEDNTRLSAPYHGVGGPMQVSDEVDRHPLTEAFVRAAQETRLPGREINIPYNHDFNGEHQEGVGFYQSMSYRGERSSTSRSFLAEAQKRGNVVVHTNALVTRIVFEGKTAVGVAVREGAGERVFKAAQEVILSAGTFMTPKLLMLSGIGPIDTLRQHGIDPILDSPNVGANYQDHMLVAFDMQLNAPVGLNGQDSGMNAIKNGLQWQLFRTGLLASNVVEAGGYFDLDGDGRPEIQLNAFGASSAGWGDPIPQEHRFSLAPLCLTCHSRGRVTLKSKDPADMPIVHSNLLHERDVENMVNGLMLSRQIVSAPSLARYMKAEALPGAAIGNTRDELREYVRNNGKTALHPTSTCAMGPEETAVVDLQLRVRGVSNLRIVDGSVMPKVIRGNTTAPIIMIAERAADLIRGRTPLTEFEPEDARSA